MDNNVRSVSVTDLFDEPFDRFKSSTNKRTHRFVNLSHYMIMKSLIIKD